MMMMITLHDSVNRACLVLHGVAKFVWIQLGGWAVRARVAIQNGRRLGANETGDRGSPSQTGFRQILRNRRPNRWLDWIMHSLNVFQRFGLVDFMWNDPLLYLLIALWLDYCRSMSLLGAVLCVAVMFISHWGFALIAITIGVCVYKYIEYRGWDYLSTNFCSSQCWFSVFLVRRKNGETDCEDWNSRPLDTPCWIWREGYHTLRTGGMKDFRHWEVGTRI